MLTMTPLRKTQAVKDIVKDVTAEVTAEVKQQDSLSHLLLFWDARFGPPQDWVKHRVEACREIGVVETFLRLVAKAEKVQEVEAQVKALLGNGV